jgi:sortase A
MSRFRKILLAAGVVLMLSGAVLFGASRYLSSRGGAEEMWDRLSDHIPKRIGGAVGVYSAPDMPVLALDDHDFCGLLELPAYGVELPVGDDWSSLNVLRWPCRYSGSAYDGSLILAGADQPEQLEVCKRLENDDVITFTDLTGLEFHYRVARVDRSDRIDHDVLTRGDFPLTLYIRDSYGMEYILVRCRQA